MSTKSILYLVDAGRQRENIAVDRLMYLVPFSHPGWFGSLGIDPVRHWCVARPKFKGLHSKRPEVEFDVDIIFGNIASGSSQYSLEYLVAVEAKAWKKERRDSEPWVQGPHAKSELWD